MLFFVGIGGSQNEADSTIAYDALGRVVSRSIAGEGSESFGYDAIGRLTSHTSDLGAFALSYLGETGQITLRQLSGSTLATAWSYLPNSGDRRLAGIDNTGLTTGQYSNYTYTTIPENFITGIGETSDQPTVYPAAGAQTASYNTLNQLTDLSGQALVYDSDGNLLSDGERDYNWDAENRLVGITYPGIPGKATAFAYDGLGRRTAIISTPSGGGAVTTSYLWCGSRPCQARDASDTPTREYEAEGELVPGSPAQPFYYGIDHLGSVRRVFASPTSAPAFDYDPYGNPLQATAPLTDYGYAGLFQNADSGLDLTMYRAYNPAIGRWLSRDPSGEGSDPVANLYRYANGNPVVNIDPSGLWGIGVIVSGSAEAGAIIGGAGVTASAGYGLFGGGQQGINTGGFVSGGAAANAGGNSLSAPASPDQETTVIAGAFAGGGGGAFYTNATSVDQLEGPFDTYSINLPGVSIQIGVSGGTVIGSVTFGPIFGYGSASSFPTGTAAGTMPCDSSGLPMIPFVM